MESIFIFLIHSLNSIMPSLLRSNELKSSSDGKPPATNSDTTSFNEKIGNYHRFKLISKWTYFAFSYFLPRQSKIFIFVADFEGQLFNLHWTHRGASASKGTDDAWTEKQMNHLKFKRENILLLLTNLGWNLLLDCLRFLSTTALSYKDQRGEK